MADHFASEEEGTAGKDEYFGEESWSHNPPPPPYEVFDSSITIDPSYIISLIRGLLPCIQSSKNGLHEEEKTGNVVGNNFVEGILQEKQNEIVYAPETPLLEDKWEDNGCILWDLSVDKSHAELMVENLILDVLNSTLAVFSSMRVKEICIGIIANLACHEDPMKIISSRHDLIDTLTNQLFLDDTQCLFETCRLLTLGIQGCGAVYWFEALQSEFVLSRVLWIAGNTLNSQLLEKCLELLLAISENQIDGAYSLLPRLMDLGLPALLASLLDGEMNILVDERNPERFPIVDLILSAIEAISVIDKYSKVISSNKDIFSTLLGFVKLFDKIELGDTCVIAVVVLANILSDEPDLVHALSQDDIFLEGLLDILSFTSGDPQAHAACWSVLARVLDKIDEEKISNETSEVMQFRCAVLLDKSDIIMEAVSDHNTDEATGNGIFDGSIGGTNSRSISLAKIASIIEKVVMSTAQKSNGDLNQRDTVCRKAETLLQYCYEHI